MGPARTLKYQNCVFETVYNLPMQTFFYRTFLVLVFLGVGSFAAWLLDDNNLLQGADTVEEVKHVITQRHIEMAAGGLLAGGLAILIVDEAKKRLLRRKST